MSEAQPDRLWSGIEITKIIAGTLAAVTAAVIGSFLGVAGTLAGAAVASVVGSVGTEIYQRSLNRGARRLGEIAPTFVKAPAAVGTPPVAAATEQESPSHTVVTPGRNIRWGRVGMAAAALFVLAMGSLTVFELLSGETVASAVGNSSSGKSTVGTLLGDDSAATPAVTPSTDATQAPSEEPTTEPTGDATPTTTEPTGEPTSDVTEQPTTDPNTGPTADTPQQTPPTDTQNQDTQNQDVAPNQDGTTTE
jgi:hypothetical protein